MATGVKRLSPPTSTSAGRRVASGWSAAELAALEAELAAEATRLRTEIEHADTASATLNRDRSSEGSGDEADAGSQSFQREHEISLSNNSRELLAQVERALVRLGDDSYGQCESCGQAIPKARLQAFPRVTLCVACKQREERR